MAKQTWIKHVGLLFTGMFGVMLLVKLTAYSQQPFWDILVPWQWVFVLDLIPIEGFNTDADGYPIRSEIRGRICVGVNALILFGGFGLASDVRQPKRRRIAQAAVFAVFTLWYLYLVVGSMIGGL